MVWELPSFVEIEMNAEIGSYQEDFDGIGVGGSASLTEPGRRDVCSSGCWAPRLVAVFRSGIAIAAIALVCVLALCGPRHVPSLQLR